MKEPMAVGNSESTNPKLKKIFISHNQILKSYTNLRIPKHVLKEMAKELEEFQQKILKSSNN